VLYADDTVLGGGIITRALWPRRHGVGFFIKITSLKAWGKRVFRLQLQSFLLTHLPQC